MLGLLFNGTFWQVAIVLVYLVILAVVWSLLKGSKVDTKLRAILAIFWPVAGLWLAITHFKDWRRRLRKRQSPASPEA